MSATKTNARLGIIGCGGIFSAHGPRLAANPEAQIAALCDIRPEATARWREKLRVPASAVPIPTYTDYREMIANEDLDGVLVLTPHYLHYEQAKHALEHGMHVLVEKPMCVEVAECQDLVDTARAHGLTLLVSYQRHYDPQYARAKRFIEAGGIGRVLLISGVLTQDWQRGCEGSWRMSKAMSGGGQLNDSGSHLQDIALWLAGSPVAEVSATIDNNGAEVDIFTSISARLQNGAVLSLVVSGGPSAWNEELSIWGTEGCIHYRNGQVKYHDTKGQEVEPGPVPAALDPDTNFVSAMVHGEPVVAKGSDGLVVQELTRAAYASAESGLRVVLR